MPDIGKILTEIRVRGLKPCKMQLSESYFLKLRQELDENRVDRSLSRPNTFLGLPFSVDPAMQDDIAVIDNIGEMHIIKL